MQAIDPSSFKIVRELPPKATKDDRVAVDMEIFNMQKTKMHRPVGDFASLQCTFDGETAYIITDQKQVPAFLKQIDKATWIFHNAKFDLFHLRRWANVPMRSKLWDTMLIDKIMWSGLYDGFSLGDLARRYLDIYIEKETREEFEHHTGEMTKEQIQYACVDVIADWRIYKHQRSIISDEDLDIWIDIDLPALWTVLGMSGLKLDVDAWRKLAEKNRTDAEKVANKYPGMNLGSWQQVLRELHRLGLKSITSTKEDYLLPYKEKYPFIQDVLEYRGKMKAASTYGVNWIDGIVEEDGRVYSDFIVNGAATGRFSSRNPNVENIPVRETPEFRKCFVAGEDNVLIDADWSAQEPRIAAYLSGDEKLLEIFKAKKDVYIESARLMFGWKLDKKDPRRKTRMKPTVLGASYGLTEYGMELKYQIPRKEGKVLLDKFFDTFPGMRRWKDKQIRIKDFVTTIHGRKYWLNPYKQGSDNNALNSPVQGSAGDALKIAGYQFMQRWGWTDCHSPIVNYVHDELLIEVHESGEEQATRLLKEVMIEVAEEMHPGIPADVEIHSGHTWHDAHG